MIGSGLAYTLAAAFLVHLAVRGYWVGLIGLKATFPRGILWERIGTMGPISKAYYQRQLPDLMSAIDRADRAGSTLFAMAVLVALMLIWVGLILVLGLLLGAGLGHMTGDAERGIRVVVAVGYALLLLVIGLLLAIDVWWIKRHPEHAERAGLRRFTELLIRCMGLLLPQRLIMPVQLTLQSNLSAKLFHTVILVVVGLAPIVGITQVVISREFSTLGGYSYLTDAIVDRGILSAHYEDQRGENDRLLRYPMIPSDRVAETYLRLFIPHLPDRDNRMLAERCPASELPEEPDARAARIGDCLSALWTVTLNGRPVSLGDFLPSERRDLGLRGLQGYVLLHGLPPGRHDLRLFWNQGGPETGQRRERAFRIPFWISPGLELESPPPAELAETDP